LEGSKLGGLGKVPSLVAFRRIQACWPLKGSKLGGFWKDSSLLALERFQAWWPLEEKEKEKKRHHFHILPLFTS
jgi:hypothetical protein